jgi:2',3'-cyclic-nucleotide 2'-phosphodiesterase (5'-nucleotidase family)
VPRYQPERLRDQLRRVGYDSIILTAHAPAGRDDQGAWTFPLQTKAKGP